MKKLFYLLFLLPLAFLASCSSDDDFPQVELTLTLSNVYQDSSNGQFYYLENEETEPLIDGLKATTLIDGKQATVANVFYAMKGYPLFEVEEDTDKIIIPANLLNEGTNYLNIRATLLQVDKSIANCALDIPITVVTADTDLPAGVTLGTYSYSMKIQPKK